MLERDVAHEKGRLETRWSELVYDGMWFSPLKEALDAFIADTQRHVTGDVRLRFEAPGLLRVVGRRSPEALYDYGLATYDAADTFRHADSEGFIRIYGLGVKTWAARQGAKNATPPDAMTLWSGRFSSSMDATMWDLSESYSFDHVLYAHDILGSKAHVQGLAAAGLLERRGVPTAHGDPRPRRRRDRGRRASSSRRVTRTSTPRSNDGSPNWPVTSGRNSTPRAAATTRSPRHYDSSRATRSPRSR